MTHLRIGMEDCTINAIVNTLLECKSISQVYSKWTVFARRLDLPEEFIDELRRSLVSEKLTNEDILPKLLHNWLSSKSDNATLSSLVTAFRKCNLNIHADLLERKFSKPSNFENAEAASSVVIDSPRFGSDNAVNSSLRTPEATGQQITAYENGSCSNSNIRTFLQRARRICIFKRGRNYGIRRLFRKSSRFISRICLSYCQFFSNTFSFLFPLLLVIIFIYRVIITPSITTTQKSVKVNVLTDLSRISSNSTTTVIPFEDTDTEVYFPFTRAVTNPKSDVSNITNVHTTVIPAWFSVNATVESWQELVKLMSDTNSTEEIDLTVNFDNLFKWGDDLILYNSHRIKSLWIKGHISLDSLANIIKQMPLLQNLVLDNIENKLCARNRGQLLLVKSVSENSVHLPILEKLRLKDFSNCVEILESLVRSYDCKQLKSLIIEEHIDNHNIHHVQELIAKYRTIRSLDLQFVNSSTKYFYKKEVIIMDKIQKLSYNLVSASGNMSKISLGVDFCDVFRNIFHLKIGNSCIPYKEVDNILHCDKLKSMNTAICFDNDDTLRDINFKNKLARLEYINIYLHFANPFNCPSIAKVKRLGLNAVGKNVKEMITVSNCPIKRDKAGIEYKSDWKQFRI